MRMNELRTLNTDIEALGFNIPTEVVKYEEYLAKLDSIRFAEGNRELQGISSVDDIEAEVDRRTDDVIRAAAKAEQIRLLKDSVHRHIEIAYIEVAEDIIEALRPIATKNHETIMKSADKLGDITTEAAVQARDLKAYDQALEAHDTLETAHRIRMRLHTLDNPDIERTLLRRIYTWRYDSLQAWRAYDALPDAGTPIANHVATARTKGITFAWLPTTDAEKQSRALGKLQAAEKRGDDDANAVWDDQRQVFWKGADAWKHA